MKINPSYTEISQAIILNKNLYLMQLRDLNPNIPYPQHWGFFAGHWENNENAEEAMKRELIEELCWCPSSMTYLGNIIVEGNRRIHVHECFSNKNIFSFDLQEGQDIGAFSKEEIASNNLFSKKLMKSFPITPISAEVFKCFIEKEPNVK